MKPSFRHCLPVAFLLLTGFVQAQNAVKDFTALCTGATLRVFKLAIACTPEFAKAATPANKPVTKEIVLAKIKEIIGAVNDIYKKELSIELQLVTDDKEKDILFIANGRNNPFEGMATDPARLMRQSHETIKEKIGMAHFDIGHTLFFIDESHSGTSAGQSWTPAVCDNDRKGMGCSGTRDLADLAVFVAKIAHEIGHQFGAYHTFNATTGLCGNPGQWTKKANVEPGSGSTLMSYPGLCKGDMTDNDLQEKPDAYFSAASLAQINAYVAGRNCYTPVPARNAVPSVSATDPKNLVIPRFTPFVLTATGRDADGDALTYCWEQMDAGGEAHDWNKPEGDRKAPLFRSFLPGADGNVRYFPRLDDILANNTPNYEHTTIGEILPGYKRPLNFFVTARDGRGGVCAGEIELKVDDEAGPFSVKEPNTQVVWHVGERKTVKWEVANTDKRPVNCKQVSVELSTDGGRTYLPAKLISSADNNGSITVPVPNTPTAEARVRVKAVNNIFFDISDRNFLILPPAAAYTLKCPDNIKAPGKTNPTTRKCEAKVTWPEPAPPATIDIPKGAALAKGKLTLIGTWQDGNNVRHSYYKSDDQYAWPIARDIAQGLGNLTGAGCHLITIASQEENDFIQGKKASAETFWIGLKNSGDVGKFEWVNGEALAFTAWAAGQPDNGGQGGVLDPVTEPYVALDKNGKWNDLPEKEKHPFLLEFEDLIVQTEGPKNGSTLEKKAQPYKVCYDASKLDGLVMLNPKTCCFSITVDCNKARALNCPKDTTFYAYYYGPGDSCRGVAFVQWPEPGDSGLVYQQISGIANYSYHTAGSYTVCYRGIDTTYQPGDSAAPVADTCCFTVKVICQNSITRLAPLLPDRNSTMQAFIQTDKRRKRVEN